MTKELSEGAKRSLASIRFYSPQYISGSMECERFREFLAYYKELECEGLITMTKGPSDYKGKLIWRDEIRLDITRKGGCGD